jgi:uncharacterized membrane protein YeaQ/YmgE (transglycosylase-associated protein family)
METIGAVIVWIVFGLFIGLIGRLLVPGRQPMGFLGTIVLGIAGSFAGGFLTYLFRGGEPLQPTGILMSIIGAIIVLVLGTSLTAKRV